MYEYRAIVNKVVDGDTVDFIVDLGFRVGIQIRARLKGVDTPERGEEGWAEATEKCRSLLQKAEAEKGYVILRTQKTGKYGRWIAEIEGVTYELAQEWPYVK